jgi:hypothetical protein
LALIFGNGREADLDAIIERARAGGVKVMQTICTELAEFEEVLMRFVKACEAMKKAQWFWAPVELTNKLIRRSILKEMFLKKNTSK